MCHAVVTRSARKEIALQIHSRETRIEGWGSRAVFLSHGSLKVCRLLELKDSKNSGVEGLQEQRKEALRQTENEPSPKKKPTTRIFDVPIPSLG